MKDNIVIFGSYNKGDEYEQKVDKVRELRSDGINVNLFYLLALTDNDELPKNNTNLLMLENIETAIKYFKPNVLAFHNGLTLSLRKFAFISAFEAIKRKYPTIRYLLEHLNHPAQSYAFRQDLEFLKWSKLNFENENYLYEIIWKSKT